MAEIPCPRCIGNRLKKEVLSVLIGGKKIIEETDLSVKDLLNFVDNLELSEKNKFIAHEILKEIKEREGREKNKDDDLYEKPSEEELRKVRQLYG